MRHGISDQFIHTLYNTIENLYHDFWGVWKTETLFQFSYDFYVKEI